MEVTLVMFKADGERREFPLRKPVTVLGRKRTCDLRIPIPSVSREHCQIENNGHGVTVRDLGSSNGTSVNDERITQAKLTAGDRLTIGPVHFVVVLDGQPAEIEPVPTIVAGESREPQEAADAGDDEAFEAIAVEEDDAPGAAEDEGLDLDGLEESPVPGDASEDAPIALEEEGDEPLAIEVDAGEDELPQEVEGGAESSIRLAAESGEVQSSEPRPQPHAASSEDDEDPFADLALDALSGDGADDGALAELAEAFPEDEEEER
jgi:pSer/pThr/pTyr-binding forkhead associated (FHA) protein